jgi:hypothetical protein
MNVDFENIYEHVISINDFRLKRRFADEMYDTLPEDHLRQLMPLDEKASKFIWDYIKNTELHKDIPFKKDFFRTID